MSVWEKEHLWLYLLALGFEPGAGAAAGKLSTHLSLGVNMFDKPNKDAFHVVARFLFTKLDHPRSIEIFRFCCPPADKKGDAEFRKQCCEWLKKISDECGNSFPPVVASLFLSPGGPKFIHLMYHFARYVIVQHMKKDSEDTNIHFPEAVNSRPHDSYKAAARYRVACIRFLQSIQREDFVIREYQRKAQLLTKQIRDPRAECAELHKLLQKMEQNSQKQTDQAERVQKVRSRWASVMETLTCLEKEKEVVDSVVDGHVDQYALDGTNVTISVPRLLLDKIENQMYKLHIGNVYEAGKLNLLTVIQLLNEALKILRYERQQVDHEALKLDLQYIEGKTKFQNKMLLGLKSMRHKLKREDHVSIVESIAEKQREWDMKWENFLGQSPFSLIKDQNPVLDLLPAMSPLSFDPATEEAYKSSVFCKYPASVPDTPKKDCQANDKKEDAAFESIMDTTFTGRMLSHLQSARQSFLTAEPSSIVLEKDVHTTPPKRKEQSVSQKILKYAVHKPRPIEAWKNGDTHVLQSPIAVKREDPIKKAQEQLAEEVADVVVSESTQGDGGKGMELDDLIGSLASNPFLTRKQIPRTPENLITEIRSSWRKAIQAEDPSDIELAQTEMVTKEAPLDLESAICSRRDSSMACFMFSSHMSDLNVSDLLERKSAVSWMTPAPKKQVVVSHVSESPTQIPATRMPDNERSWELGSKHTVSSKSLTENLEESIFPTVDKSMNPLDNSAEREIKTDALSPYFCQNSSVHTTLSWDASQMVSSTSSDSNEVIQFGILHETLPEELGNISLNSSESLETDNEVECNSRDSKSLENIVKNEWAAQECKQDLQSIRNRYEALKKTVFGNEEDSFQSPRKQFLRHRSERNLIPGCKETKEIFSPLGKHYALDAEYIKTPSHMSVFERRHTLSPLIAFSPVQERLRSMTQKKPGDFLHNLKEENLKEKLDAKESSSDIKTRKDEAVSHLIEL
ncbi:HAUS augmin-like complex subunit 6 isoform X2 [Gopherus flavomarginatus]|uniref:HAUS augmin-like complex subunit 6 isoform X2 n=1 Tax=Gopherus flavomarginatus TaxID=286002 RepID=UPI0021CC00BA|nr:HAUS augmin-like complex subunit 6 isoform X2 [Gopherus flavomarginatus]